MSGGENLSFKERTGSCPCAHHEGVMGWSGTARLDTRWSNLSDSRNGLFTNRGRSTVTHRGADKSLAQPGRKQATATEDFDFHISYL